MGHSLKVISFTEDLAVLMSSGADVNAGLATIIDTQADNSFKPVLRQIRTELQQGEMLSTTLAQHPQLFDSYYVGMVSSGEASGHLAETLKQLANQLEMNRDLAAQITNALIYPAILIVVMSLSMVIVLGIILPKFTDLFASVGTQLSPAATLVLNLGNFVNAWGVWILSAAIILTLTAWLFRRKLKLSALLMRLAMRAPGISTLINQIDFARFSATFASLLDSGMSQIKALSIAAQGFTQEHNRAQLTAVIDQVRQGQSLGASLARFDGIGQLYATSISNGEQGGQLPATLRTLAARLEKDFVRRAHRLAAIIEPLLIVVFGLVIGLVVYAVFSALQSLGGIPL